MNSNHNSGVRIMPTNYNIVGTCGKCGGPVVQSIFWVGDEEPSKSCLDCKTVVKKQIKEAYGPILEMEE